MTTPEPNQTSEQFLSMLMETWFKTADEEELNKTRAMLASLMENANAEYTRYLEGFIKEGLAQWDAANPAQAGAGEFNPKRQQVRQLLAQHASLNWLEGVLRWQEGQAQKAAAP